MRSGIVKQKRTRKSRDSSGISMEQIQTPTAKWISARKKLLRRILAGVLAFAMVLSSALLFLTRIVNPEQIEVSESTADSAYQALFNNSKYLSATAVERVGMLLREIGRQPETAEEFEQVASMYVGRGNYAEAAVLFESSVQQTDVADKKTIAARELKLGSAYVLGGDMERAEKSYIEALGNDDSLALAHLLLGQIYFEQKRYDEAIESVRAYLKLVPNDAQSRTMLGNLYESTKQYDLAYTEYLSVYAQAKNAQNCMNVARAALLNGKYPEGYRYLSEYLEQSGDPDGSVHYLRGAALLGQKNYSEAKTDYLEAIKLGYSDTADCYVQLTLCTYMLGDFANTLVYGGQAESLWKTPSAECLQRMGLAQMQLGDYAASIANLQKSIAADATLTENYYYMATGYLLTKDYPNARDAYSTAIQNGYLLQECYYNRAICYLQMENYDAAILDLEACLDAGNDESIQTSATEILKQLGVEN